MTLYGYQRGLMDVMCDPRIPLVTVLKAARVGYTRCFTLAVGYHLDHDPTLCAIAQPTIPDAEDFGGTEIAPMLRETPVLAKLMRPVRKGEKQDKATFYQLSNGATVRIVGAASDDAFRRYSARFLAADEIDGEGWTPGAKTQGDKLKLFWTRGETFWNRKQIRGSTPLLEETSRVWKLWLQSDQRRYFVPCPHCSAQAGDNLAGWQYLEWGGKEQLHGLKWETDGEGRLLSVRYRGSCGHDIDESHKVWMDAHGEWRPTAVPKQPGHVGMHLWTGMSLNPNAAWPVIVQEWLEAQEDPATKVQPFVNLRLGRPYRATYGQEVASSAFLDRRELYAAELPNGVEILTVGADVQSGVDARIEAAVYGWGRGLECWLIGHFVLRGDPAHGDVWESLNAVLTREFVREDGRKLVIQAAAIDSGGHYTSETYTFCNERRARRIWAIKGKSEVMGRRSPVWPRKPSSKLGSVWYMIGGNAARDWAYGSLAVAKAGARFVHFPQVGATGSRAIDDEFFAQLTREKLVSHKGRYTDWSKTGVREAGVCFVYAYAAVCGLQAQNGRFLDLTRIGTAFLPDEEAGDPAADQAPSVAETTAQPEPEPSSSQETRGPAPQPEPRRHSFLPPRRPGGWMNRDRY